MTTQKQKSTTKPKTTATRSKAKAKEIKAEPILWINKRRENMIRQEKAESYSERCKRRLELRKQRKRAKMILGAFVLSSVFICGIMFTYKPATQEVSAEKSTMETVIMETETETRYIYPDCKVVSQYDAEDYTVLICEMPDGSLHDYNIVDPPEGKIDIAMFQTDNQDDYESYEFLTAIQLNGNHINLESVVSIDVTETEIKLHYIDGTVYTLGLDKN